MIKKVIDILGTMPIKTQKQVLHVIDFKEDAPAIVFHKVVETMINLSKNAHQREILQIYLDIPIDDKEVIEAFGIGGEASKPMTFTEEQFDFIKDHIYRNRDGEFRLIPEDGQQGADQMPLEGLSADEPIINSRLHMVRTLPNGTTDEWDGFKFLKEQPYEGPYAEPFDMLEPNLRRIEIVSSFNKDNPFGFYKHGQHLYRNVCCQMNPVDGAFVCKEGLDRAMLLLYLVSGADLESFESLYKLVHFMVRVPDSATGYILYLNDFDAGGNGKSKFVQVLQNMFGNAFTSFATQQLRFTMSLMGKRLVSISEFEEMASQKELLGILKSMTGRDKFQYEGKGVDPIIGNTYQNFVIASNKYITFDDGGINRRLQNFHCSNVLHILLTQYFHSYKFLNMFFGNQFTGESRTVMKQMSNSLLNYILNDSVFEDIKLRQQPIILGNLKNPVLRALFASNVNFESFIRTDKSSDGSVIDLWRITADAKPEQLNYAAERIQQWLPTIKFNVARDAMTMACGLPDLTLVKMMRESLALLDNESRLLKNRYKATLQLGTWRQFDISELIKTYLGDALKTVPHETVGDSLIIGS